MNKIKSFLKKNKIASYIVLFAWFIVIAIFFEYIGY